MNSQEAIDKCAFALSTRHLAAHGGYPYDTMQTDDSLIVAELDDGKDRNRTVLCAYSLQDCEEWGQKWGQYIQEDDPVMWWLRIVDEISDEMMEELYSIDPQ